MDTMNIEKKVYDAEDIQKLLGIGRSKAYTFWMKYMKTRNRFE